MLILKVETFQYTPVTDRSGQQPTPKTLFWGQLVKLQLLMYWLKDMYFFNGNCDLGKDHYLSLTKEIVDNQVPGKHEFVKELMDDLNKRKNEACKSTFTLTQATTPKRTYGAYNVVKQ